jgi:Esterase/lipase
MMNRFRRTRLALSWLLIFGMVEAAAAGSTSDGGVTVHRDVSYLAADRTEKMDIYLPPDWTDADRRPAVLWIHGGGWLGGDKAARRERAVCTELAKAGFVCASVNYRLGDGAWPQNLEDCRDGVRFLRARARAWGIDLARIGVAGGSAGAHLALMVAYASKVGDESEKDGGSALYPNISYAVNCVIDCYGITDLRDRRSTEPDGTPTQVLRAGGPANVFGTDDPSAEVFRNASPVEHVSRTAPPTLILHGKADTTVDRQQAEALARALERHGVPHELVMIEGVGHTFDLETWRGRPLPIDAKSMVLRFLVRHLGVASDPVAKVNGSPVTVREYVEALRRLRSRHQDPEELRRAALVECVRFVATLQLAQTHNLVPEVSDVFMRNAFAEENQRRADASAAGAVVYGPKQLTWEQFRAVWLDGLHYDLARVLSAGEVGPVEGRQQMRPLGGVESVEQEVDRQVQTARVTTNDAWLRVLDANTPLPEAEGR